MREVMVQLLSLVSGRQGDGEIERWSKKFGGGSKAS